MEDDAPSPQIERLPERDPSSASQSTRAKPQVAVRVFRWALPRPLPRRRPCRPAPRPSALRPAGYPASGLCPVGAGSAPAASRLSPSPTILHAIGAHGRIRTCDTSFRKRVLYPLSYVGRAGTLDCTPGLTTAHVPSRPSVLPPLCSSSADFTRLARSFLPGWAGSSHRDSTIGLRQVRRTVTEKS